MRLSCASLADETPEGRSIVVLAKTEYGLAGSGRQVVLTHATWVALHRARPG